MSASTYNEIRRIIFSTANNPKRGFALANEWLEKTYKNKLGSRGYAGLKAELYFYEKHRHEFKLTVAGDMGEHADFSGMYGTDATRFDVTTNLDFKKFHNYEPHMGDGLYYKIALLDKNNFEIILNYKKNIFIDDFLKNINEEQIFHLINHCSINKLTILFTSNKEMFEHNFFLQDLLSRIKTFHTLRIDLPDDDLIINLMIKLLHDKQIIIKNEEIFHYILKRIERSYEEIFLLIEKIDKLSLEKKRELTIPLIKKLL